MSQVATESLPFKQSWWQRPVTRFAATKPGSWLFSHTAHRADNLILRLTRRKHSLTTLLTNLPVVTVVYTGAKSGLQRSVPLLGIPDGNNIVLVASNFGRSHHPAWYYNLRTNPNVSLNYNGISGEYRAHEATGIEHEALWQQAVQLYAGYAAYQRCAQDRKIPIIVLTPQSETDLSAMIGE